MAQTTRTVAPTPRGDLALLKQRQPQMVQIPPRQTTDGHRSTEPSADWLVSDRTPALRTTVFQFLDSDLVRSSGGVSVSWW